MKVVFILGSGHCGSTLLDLLLDSHSQVVGVGEMHGATVDAQCTCGLQARACSFWTTVLGSEPWPRREIYEKKTDFLLGRHVYRSGLTNERIDTQEYKDATVAAYKRILDSHHAHIIVDSSKSVERAQILATSDEVTPVVIHLVRDARAVTWSYIRKYHELIPFLYSWGLSNLKIELFKCRFKGVMLYVRYEAFVSHPEETVRALCRELNIQYEPAMLAFRESVHHQIGGNRMRLGGGRDIKRDEMWRYEMPAYWKFFVTLTFGWLNVYYRYTQSL